jgi:hypothetical protein
MERSAGGAMPDLKPLADSLETYARQIHSIAEIIRSFEEEAHGPSDAAPADTKDTERRSDANQPRRLDAKLPAALGWQALPVISDKLDTTAVIEAHAAPVVDTISPEAICQRILADRKPQVRAIEWMPEKRKTRGSRRMWFMRTFFAFTILIALTSQ